MLRNALRRLQFGCGRTPNPKIQDFRGQAGFPACCSGTTGLLCEGRDSQGARNGGPHHDNGGDVERTESRHTHEGVNRFSPSRLHQSYVPPTSDHESVFLEDRSRYRDGSWWEGSGDPSVSRPTPLVGAWHTPRAPHRPVRANRKRPGCLGRSSMGTSARPRHEESAR
jgi:hypothetical protein